MIQGRLFDDGSRVHKYRARRSHRGTSFGPLVRCLLNNKYYFLSLSITSAISIGLITWQLGSILGVPLNRRPKVQELSQERLDYIELPVDLPTDGVNRRQQMLSTQVTTVQSTTSHRQQAVAANDWLLPRYVSLCPQRMFGYHRLGNQLFFLAATLYTAVRTGRHILMPSGPLPAYNYKGWVLDEPFDFPSAQDDDGLIDDDVITIDRLNVTATGVVDWPCPCTNIVPDTLFDGDRRLDTEEGLAKLSERSSERFIALCGLYQVYRYADAMAGRLRRLLRFRPEVRQEAELFRNATRPDDWDPNEFVRIGIHVRRGDFLNSSQAEGLTVVDEGYLDRAIEHLLTERHLVRLAGKSPSSQWNKVQLVVATDDWNWTSQYFQSKFVNAAPWMWLKLSQNTYATLSNTTEYRNNGPSVSIAFSDETQLPAVDLAILADCDAVIMSTGSFGWWAAWLANRTTVYYRRWPRDDSYLYTLFNRDAYFPPHWIPLV